MKVYLLFTSLAALIMFAGAAISSDMMTGNGGAVKIQSYAFGPKTITSQPGKEIVWINNDSASHSILIDGHESPRLRKGGEYHYTFSASGEYHYQCGIHPAMKGTIIITENGTGNTSPSIPTSLKPRPVTEKSMPAMSSTSTPQPRPKAVQNDIAAGKDTVSIVDFMRFSPEVLTVTAGTEVTWNNHDGSNHIIQVGNIRSPRLRHNASFSYRFDKPGEYPYICGIHGNKMSGKIIVK
ncbi:copper binding protein [gamma proteobacterium BDW918]|uniref:cupredoxin domain-containing protein n=1 Tax=Zhongshania aliphaticivorans TaxID=1470434 RepID=UPI00025C1A32|nr:cupredoxin domain-containing protein [Zhongshania aliphaticivorans]EIF42404.1 copper binding protein [gamma proteobacterium BDW918]